MSDTDSTALLTAGGIAAGAGSAVGGEKAIRAIVAKVTAVRAEKKRLREEGNLPPGMLERMRLERERKGFSEAARPVLAQLRSITNHPWSEERELIELENLIARKVR